MMDVLESSDTTDSSDQQVTITVSLPEAAAWEFAQFCKRSTFTTFFEHTEAHLSREARTAKAYQMIAGIERIMSALRTAGIAPR